MSIRWCHLQSIAKPFSWYIHICSLRLQQQSNHSFISRRWCRQRPIVQSFLLPYILDTDITSGKCNTFIPIDDSQLYTLKALESAIFVNEQDEIIAVVIRDFARDYYDIIKPWAEELINDSMKRRTLSQRNGPGKLARVGVTDGPRNARVFGS